jgi:NIPSNAP
MKITPEAGAESSGAGAGGDGVVELRQYTLHAGQRHVLVSLLEREFIEAQEEVGAHVLGHFYDVNDGDRFVWLRSFENMESRRKALESFYYGPVWAQHRAEANATMMDSADVLLLRPTEPVPLSLAAASFRPSNANSASSAVFAVTVYELPSPEVAQFAAHYAASIYPVLHDAGVDIVATMGSADERNTFPALPIREGVNCFVAVARHQSTQAHADFTRAWEASPAKRSMLDDLRRRSVGVLQELTLLPARRSLLR